MKDLMLEDKINPIIEKNNFSGVISIREKGKIIYENAVGFADKSNKISINRETRFGIASGTKFFTALAIGKLIEEGKLSLETKVFDIIKYDFPLYAIDITIEHLLTHTSGIPDYYDEEKIDDFNNFCVDIPWYKLREPKDYFPVFPQEDMKFLPGERFSYCNSGFVLLAAIVQEVSGSPYARFVEEHVFKAIGMNNSGFFELNRLPENTALGYIRDEYGWRTNIYNLPIVGGGDGGAFTTVGDLYILWDSFFNYKILSKSLTDLYIKPHIKAESEGEDLYYGLGIWLCKKENSQVEFIVGCDAGVSFQSAINRMNEITYTVISNTGDGAWPIIEAIEDFFCF
jgi:CubicO group peptidase (beta-lactamase class C family)